jgi:hypothetical protein
MPGLHVTLGYYPQHCDIRTSSISLVDLPDREQCVAQIEACQNIHNDWLYTPLQPHRARNFGLPKTHVLTHDNADSVDHLEFLVWCIGFFTGMRLTTTERGFLDATPIKPGKLNDFVLSNCALADAVALSESFWQQHAQDKRKIKRVIGIIHALFLSQYPPYLQFEEFMYLYIALDACFALFKSLFNTSESLPHAARLDRMCQRFGMSTPNWALPNAQKKTEVSVVRNDSLHEALFFEQPLGFAIYGGNNPSSQRRNVPLEMRALTCRLLVALFGKLDCDYISSPVNTRQRYGLNLA